MKYTFPRYVLLLPVFMVLMASCGSLSHRIDKSEVYGKNHTGFYLFDPAANKVLADFNGEKYFTPASNTKIFTFFTGLNILGDSVPGFKYRIAEDSLIIWGTGDPSFLHPDLPQSQVFSFLKAREEKIYISLDNFQDDSFGPGWAWDDYPYYFQPEKSPLPVYGNVAQLRNRPDTAGIDVYPDYFSRFLYPKPDVEPGYIQRDLGSNILYSGKQPDSISFKKSIPFNYSAEILTELLADTLHKEIEIIDRPIDQEALTLYSIPSDSLYKLMMEVSDNFIAEQILLMCAGLVSDTLQTQIAIDYSIDNLLTDLPDKPVWRDGSGLSRYNLFTPRTIVKLWEKIYEMVPEERLFELIAEGGISGTIKDWYSAEEPYIFGKTGTLSNNHTLSGFIKTRKGKTLIFSFMHNNYTSSSTEIKREMEKTLREIHEKY